jgi:hypothetical protein
MIGDRYRRLSTLLWTFGFSQFFLSYFGELQRQGLTLRYDRFLPHPLQFISNIQSCDVNDGVIKRSLLYLALTELKTDVRITWNTVFRDITPSSLLATCRRFGVTYCLHLENRGVNQTGIHREECFSPFDSSIPRSWRWRNTLLRSIVKIYQITRRCIFIVTAVRYISFGV